MLRDYAHTPNNQLVADILQQFDVEVPNASELVITFSELSPDSFVWKVRLGEAQYLIYAEDYVPGLDHAKMMINKHSRAKWRFVEPRIKQVFNQASPVRGATVYAEPDDSDELMTYAATSGVDFVFLAKIEK